MCPSLANTQSWVSAAACGTYGPTLLVVPAHDVCGVKKGEISSSIWYVFLRNIVNMDVSSGLCCARLPPPPLPVLQSVCVFLGTNLRSANPSVQTPTHVTCTESADIRSFLRASRRTATESLPSALVSNNFSRIPHPTRSKSCSPDAERQVS